MLSKHCIVRVSLCLILLGLVAAVPAIAGSAVIGLVAGSMNATVGGQTLFPNTTLYSGDRLQVGEGVAVVALGSASRMVFGHDTVASFLRDSNEVTVLLGQGNVSVFQDVNGMPVRVKIGDVSVVPVSGFKTLGEVATLNGAVVVTAKDGTLRVDNNGQVVNVAKGKTITVVPRTKAPQGGGGGGKCCSMWGMIDAGAAGVAAILAGVAISKADDATSAANSATSAANAATSAANAAASAAVSAANAATSTANQVGCALDALVNPEGMPPGVSPYLPVPGMYCQ